MADYRGAGRAAELLLQYRQAGNQAEPPVFISQYSSRISLAIV